MVLWTACLVYTHVKLINNAIKQFEEQNRVLVKELEKQGKSFEIFSSATLEAYRSQGGNILEFIAEGISGTREEITLLGMEGAKARRILYGFFPPGAFRLINKMSTVFQFLGGAVRRSTDSGKEHQKNLIALRKERDKHVKDSEKYLEMEDAIAAHMQGGQGKVSPVELLMKGFNKIPKFSLYGKTNLEGKGAGDFKSSKFMKGKENELNQKLQDRRLLPIIKNTNTVLQRFQKAGLGTEFNKSNRKATRAKLKNELSSMKMSRDEKMTLKYSSSLRTEGGTFGRRLKPFHEAQLSTGLKDPSQLEQAKNIQKLLNSSTSISFMIGEVLPQLKLRFEQGKKVSALTKLFLFKHAFKLAKLATLAFSLLTTNPKKLAGKLWAGTKKGFQVLFKAPFNAVKAISRFIILMSGYILYYGIIFSALIIAFRKPILKGFMAFKEGFATVMPVILFALNTVWGGFKKIYQGFKSGDLFTIIEGILQVAFGLLLGLWAVALAIWAGFISFIGAFVSQLFEQARDYVKSFMDGFGANYETLKKGVIILTLLAGLLFSWPAIVAGIVIMIGIVIGKTLYNNLATIQKFLSDKLDAVIDAINPIKQGKKSLSNLSSKVINVPAFANGGVSKGGMALVGEKGPEIVNLAKGSRVHSNTESKKMVGHTFNITVNARDSSKVSCKDSKDFF